MVEIKHRSAQFRNGDSGAALIEFSLVAGVVIFLTFALFDCYAIVREYRKLRLVVSEVSRGAAVRVIKKNDISTVTSVVSDYLEGNPPAKHFYESYKARNGSLYLDIWVDGSVVFVIGKVKPRCFACMFSVPEVAIGLAMHIEN